MAATAADNITEDLTGTLWRYDEWLKCAARASVNEMLPRVEACIS